MLICVKSFPCLAILSGVVGVADLLWFAIVIVGGRLGVRVGVRDGNSYV